MPSITDALQRSLDIVKEFYAAKERHALDAVVSLLADDVVYNFPLNATGTPKPWFTYDGKQATVDYQRATLSKRLATARTTTSTCSASPSTAERSSVSTSTRTR